MEEYLLAARRVLLNPKLSPFVAHAMVLPYIAIVWHADPSHGGGISRHKPSDAVHRDPQIPRVSMCSLSDWQQLTNGNVVVHDAYKTVLYSVVARSPAVG